MASVMTQVNKPIFVVGKSVNVDYKFGPYDTLAKAETFLVNGGYAVSGLEFGVKQSDGSVKKYRFVDDSGNYEACDAALSVLDNKIDGEKTRAQAKEAELLTAIQRTQMALKGEYSASEYYLQYDIVSWNGASYICRQDCHGVSPSNLDKWQLQSARGEAMKYSDLTASQKAELKGEQGIQGNSGVASADGITSWNSLNDPSTIAEDTTTNVNVAGAKATATKFKEIQNTLDSLNAGMLANIIEVEQAGFYIVDSAYRIGFSVTDTKVTGANIFDVELIND